MQFAPGDQAELAATPLDAPLAATCYQLKVGFLFPEQDLRLQVALPVAEHQVAGRAHHLGVDDQDSFSTDQARDLGVWG